MHIRFSFFLFALLPTATAQIQFNQLTTSGPRVTEHGMAYDSSRSLVVLFGGGNGPTTLGNTWTYDGASWQQRPSPPPARRRPAMAYDAARDRVVMFGGVDGNNQMLGDTWTWDGTSWQQRVTPGPSVRSGAAMAYDSDRQVVVLFGGWVPSGNDNDETWEWNGSSWTRRFPAQRPGPRGAHRMVYDGFNQQMVLFGGWSTPMFGTLGDTWIWDGNNWQQQPGAGPSNRCDPSMAFDDDRVRVTLYGGLLRFNGQTPVMTGDTWEWNGSGWSRLFPTGSPSSRSYAEAVYDQAGGRVVLHGGNDPVTTYTNTYSLASVNPAQIDPFGTGCAGSAGVPALEKVDYSLPWIGTTFDLRLTGAAPAAGIGFLLWGLSNTTWNGVPLPANLTPLGLPGCQAWVSLDVTSLMILTGGTGTVTGGLPNSTALVGGVFYAQALVLDPGVMRPVPGAVTNGVEIRIGAR